MAKTFNTTAVCVPEKHYMVNIEGRLYEIGKLIGDGKYFTVNRARQYGKTTTLLALIHYLKNDYSVVFLDFQILGSDDFSTEHSFSLAFASSFLDAWEWNGNVQSQEVREVLQEISQEMYQEHFTLRILFGKLGKLCAVSDKPVVLIIDEIDSASNNQVFLDFLAQLRAQYIKRFQQPAFKSVILAGVYDIKNLKRKIRPEEKHKYNSPWNIAADFKVDMSFSAEEIAEMLQEYESDHHTEMNTTEIADWIYCYTSGYPFLVSRLCQLIDEDIGPKEPYCLKKAGWNKTGFQAAVRMLLAEKNTLFESLSEKLESYPDLREMLASLLFSGKTIAYNYYEPAINIATILGLVKNENGAVSVSNRIFETWLYNLYLSSAEMQKKSIYEASLRDKNQFIKDGQLNMKMILEMFVCHFHEIYGDKNKQFLEEEGRKYFLLYLRPIINGTGNYYIEARTRNMRRTDVIIDYLGEQYIIEMKIWHGEEYNNRGERQLIGYLDDYHKNKGYMLSFSFNKNKQIGVHETVIDGKTIIEAVV